MGHINNRVKKNKKYSKTNLRPPPLISLCACVKTGHWVSFMAKLNITVNSANMLLDVGGSGGMMAITGFMIPLTRR